MPPPCFHESSCRQSHLNHLRNLRTCKSALHSIAIMVNPCPKPEAFVAPREWITLSFAPAGPLVSSPRNQLHGPALDTAHLFAHQQTPRNAARSATRSSLSISYHCVPALCTACWNHWNSATLYYIDTHPKQLTPPSLNIIEPQHI
jgi:hypothetical protein